MKGTYMVYVDSYSHTGNVKGITVYDVDVENGRSKERHQVEVDDSSYLVPSNDGETLYSTADEGVVSFRIHKNESITCLNMANIRGIRRCHLPMDSEDRYLFISEYHDGKATVMYLNPDGSIGDIAAGVYHRGPDNMVERTFRLHVNCCRMMPGGRLTIVANLGIDQAKVYRFNESDKEPILVDTIPCDLESTPRYFIFSPDEKFIYLVHEVRNVIDVYTYEAKKRTPVTEKIQTISTTGKKRNQLTAVCAVWFSSDTKYLFYGNAGDDTVSIYKRGEKTGMLEQITYLLISGGYPKDITVFPDNKHIASSNHETENITFFKVDYEAGLLVTSSKGVEVGEPNCCAIVKVGK